MNYIHINLTVGFSESTNGWGDGQGQSTVQFDIPQDMYNGSSFAKMVETAIIEAKGKYPKAKEEAEARNEKWAREREEKRLKEQVEKESTAS